MADTVARMPGAIVSVHAADKSQPLAYCTDEVSSSINTAAAGGNASLMAIG